MKYHKRFGLFELEIIGSNSGEKIFQTETTLKMWFKAEIDAIEGTSENWATTAMEVHSVAELKAKSGVETDLF